MNIQNKGRYARGPPISVSKKTLLPRRPLLFSGTDVRAEHRREEIDREREAKHARIRAMGAEEEEATAEESAKPEWIKPYLDADPKGKRKAEDDLAPDPAKKSSIEKIIRASANRATRVTGRSIGIARFEEMIAFERQGIEMGYLPPDFSLAK